jgi:hypothetical protein
MRKDEELRVEAAKKSENPLILMSPFTRRLKFVTSLRNDIHRLWNDCY